MALIKHECDRFRFFGTDGRFHTIRPVSITTLIELVDYLTILGNTIASHPEHTFEALYLEDEEVRECCNEIVSLSGVSPSVVSADILVALLFKSERSPYPKGIIHHLNRLDREPTEQGEGGGGTSLDDYRMKLCVGLINTGLAADMAKAEAIIDTAPLSWVENAIAFRAESLKSPEEKKKEKLDQKIKEAQDRQTEQMKKGGVGALFEGMKGGKMITNPAEIMRLTATQSDALPPLS